METIRSKDGTMIAYEKTGRGAPLVLVHGTTADHQRWAPVLPAFNARFTVYAVDRRGRGGSGETPPYAIEKEFDDIAAVVDSIPGPVNLLGHSYGGICSLEASIRTSNLKRLVLYEPPIALPSAGLTTAGGNGASEANRQADPQELVVDRLKALLEAGKPAEVVATFMREVVHMPPRELDLLMASPAWAGRVAAAFTIPRELDTSAGSYSVNLDKFKNMRTPTLLLLGGDSPAFFKNSIDKLHATLLDNRLVVLPGQQHAAIDTAPELFARTVLDFLAE